MITAYFVYTFLLFFLCFLGYLIQKIDINPNLSKNNKHRQQIFIFIFIIFVYTLILGTRVNTGIDYKAYFNFFLQYDLTKNFYRNHEPLFKLLIMITSEAKIHFNFIIVSFAFITIGSFLYACKYYKSFLIVLMFFFAYFVMLDSINIMRQNAAFCLLFAAMSIYVNQGDKKIFFLFLLLAIACHYSAILAIIAFPFIMRKELFHFWLIPIILRCFCFIFAFDIYFLLPDYFYLIDFELINGYNNYLNIENFEKLTRDADIAKSTFFPYILLFFDILVIYFYNHIKLLNKNICLTPFYNLFVIGIILYPILYYNMTLSRCILYFSSLRFFFYALLIDYFLKHNLYKVLGYFSLGTFFLLFCKFIYNRAGECAPFYFIEWDVFSMFL